jgi:Domain of unknown function (DUF4440)
MGWALILVCASVFSVRAQEGGEGSIASSILVLEHAWFDGESRNDNRALDRIFDNDLVYVEDGRTMTKAEYLLRLKLATPHPYQVVLEATAVRTFGSTAIVVGTYREKSQDRKTSPRRWRFVDTWVNKKGSWMLVAAGSSLQSK